MDRIYLSPPFLSGAELRFLRQALDSNWIAPLGPQVDAFEDEIKEIAGVEHAVALSSGTAGLHLALEVLGVGQGDLVICPTLTFVATANAIRYCGAEPLFVDSEPGSWNLDPRLLEQALDECRRHGKRPAAVVTVDLYGQCANYEEIEPICAAEEIPVLEDAAEALGATCHGRPAGSFGAAAVFSFNGNKIVTTSGGGMLVSNDRRLVEKARHLATQARDPAPHYQHSELGYNYRLSNLLAAVGRGQLADLDDRVTKRRRAFRTYERLLGNLPGITFQPEATHGRSNRWLTCLTIDERLFGADRETVRVALEAQNIESRPLWKPMHLQPLYQECRIVGGTLAEDLFEHGLCLPSGAAMSSEDFERVADIVRTCHRSESG